MEQNNIFRPPGNEAPWKSEYKLEKEDQDRILSRIQDKELFKEVIKKRDPQSANGPNDIGYLPLQLRIDLSAKYKVCVMAIISKLMMKHSVFPTIWNAARTILIYIKDNPNEINNWRPITIAPCMYIICAVAAALQKINEQEQNYSMKTKKDSLEESMDA